MTDADRLHTDFLRNGGEEGRLGGFREAGFRSSQEHRAVT